MGGNNRTAWKVLFVLTFLIGLCVSVQATPTPFLSGYDAQNVLSMLMNQSPAHPNWFNDSSPSQHIFVTAGDATTILTEKSTGNASYYGDGTGDRISSSDSSDWTMGAGDFTLVIDSYIPTSFPDNSMVFTQYDATNGYAWFVSSDIGLWRFQVTNATGRYGWDKSNGILPSIGVWERWVFERSGDNLYLWRNGTLVGVKPFLGSQKDSTGRLTIGGLLTAHSANIFDNIGLWKGVAIPVDDVNKWFEVGTTVKYYAYGDSITRGTKTGSDLNPDGTDVYNMYMQRTYDTLNSSAHNQDGGGKNSTWAWENIGSHYSNSTQYYIVLIGTNDRNTDVGQITAAQTVANLANIYNYTIANGSTPVICINTLYQDDGATDWKLTVNQQNNITLIQNGLSAAGIPYLKMYDSIDTIPYNGIPDEYNASNYYDWIHPNKLGHQLMGTYLRHPVANLSLLNYIGKVPFTTRLTDTSVNTSTYPLTYYTDLGDGNSSTEKDLYYTWNSTGAFIVNHLVTNGISTSYYKVNVTVIPATTTEPVAAFQGGPTTGPVQLRVFFTDVSSNTPTSWFWEFGDGTNSTEQNPTHIYSRSGFKTVNLTATNSAGSNITVRAKFVKAS
jgi:PKD repeat protein